jgi:ELWxxDGT repeat protein
VFTHILIRSPMKFMKNPLPLRKPFKIMFSAANSLTWKTTVFCCLTMAVFVVPALGQQYPQSHVVLNGITYFTAIDEAHGRELWRSDGTPAGTVLVKDLLSGQEGSGPKELVVMGGHLYFTAINWINRHGVRIRSLWKSDGTASGTVVVKDFNHFPSDPDYPEYEYDMYKVSSLLPAGEKLFFRVKMDVYEEQLWVTNGSPEGTFLLKEFGPDVILGRGIDDFFNLNGTLFFTWNYYERWNEELWKSDGTPEGTQLVKDFRANFSDLANFTQHGNALHFAVYVEDWYGEYETTYWRTDGNPACTMQIKDFYPTSSCSTSGSLTREYWANVPGNAVNKIPVNQPPSHTSLVSSFEGPKNVGDSYGSRIRGYLHAPATGNYTFWIAGDNNVELWLGTDDSPTTKRKIAEHRGFTAPRQWNKHPSQQSKPVRLETGKRYYIEALHKEGVGGDHVAVGWKLPSGVTEAPIGKSRISPFVPDTNVPPIVQLVFPGNNTTFYAGQQIPLQAEATDPYGLITKVEFFSGPTRLGTTASAPFTNSWGSAQPGTHRLTAVATDNQGATTRSEEVEITGKAINREFAVRDRAFGGSATENLATLIKTSDGGYLAGGSSDSGKGGDKTEPSRGGLGYWVVKEGKDGQKQWDRTFGGTRDDKLTLAMQTRDGGYLLAGSSSSGVGADKTQPSKGGYDYWIVKVSATGTKQWDKTFGGTGMDEFRSMVQTADGGYLLGGFSDSPAGGDKSEGVRGNMFEISDYWIVKTDGMGEKQWDRTIGGSGQDELSVILPVADKGYLLAGSSNSPAGYDKSRGKIGDTGEEHWTDYWVVKIGLDGAVEWDRTYGGNEEQWLTAALATPDGGYLLGGSSSSPIGGDKTEGSVGNSAISWERVDYWVVKINDQGLRTWDRTIGGDRGDFLAAMAPYTDGSFLLGGTSTSGISGHRTTANRGGRDFWVVQLNVTEVEDPVAACLGTGSILRERWDGVPGHSVYSIPVNTVPSGTDLLTSFEAPANVGDHYGSRIRGYVCPPLSGYYTLHISGDNNVNLYLSTGADPMNKRLIAYLTGFTAPREWGKQASQTSAPVHLEAGQRYYIEALHKEGVGGDHVAVAWRMPNGTLEAPIAGNRLSPFELTAEQPALATYLHAQGPQLTAFPNPFSDQTTLQFTLPESGEASLEVYDLNGRLVRRLFAGEAEAGTAQEFTFDGRDLARGLYLARLVTGQRVLTRKIMLTR